MELDYNKYLSQPQKSYEPKWEIPNLPMVPLGSTIYNNKFERIGSRRGNDVFNTFGSKIGTVSGIDKEVVGDFGKSTGLTCSPAGFIGHKPAPLIPLPSMASPFGPPPPMPKYIGW